MTITINPTYGTPFSPRASKAFVGAAAAACVAALIAFGVTNIDQQAASDPATSAPAVVAGTAGLYDVSDFRDYALAQGMTGLSPASASIPTETGTYGMDDFRNYAVEHGMTGLSPASASIPTETSAPLTPGTYYSVEAPRAGVAVSTLEEQWANWLVPGPVTAAEAASSMVGSPDATFRGERSVAPNFDWVVYGPAVTAPAVEAASSMVGSPDATFRGERSVAPNFDWVVYGPAVTAPAVEAASSMVGSPDATFRGERSVAPNFDWVAYGPAVTAPAVEAASSMVGSPDATFRGERSVAPNFDWVVYGPAVPVTAIAEDTAEAELRHRNAFASDADWLEANDVTAPQTDVLHRNNFGSDADWLEANGE